VPDCILLDLLLSVMAIFLLAQCEHIAHRIKTHIHPSYKHVRIINLPLVHMVPDARAVEVFAVRRRAAGELISRSKMTLKC